THKRLVRFFGHRPRDGSVVSSLHCMNDPQPEGHMASYIRRRKFLATVLGSAVTAWPLAARAQQPGKVLRIGFLFTGSLESPEGRLSIEALRQGLHQHGYIEDQNTGVEYRAAEGGCALLASVAG